MINDYADLILDIYAPSHEPVSPDEEGGEKSLFPVVVALFGIPSNVLTDRLIQRGLARHVPDDELVAALTRGSDVR